MGRVLFTVNLFIVYTCSVLIKNFPLKAKKNAAGILYFENFPIENAGYQYRAKKWSEILESEAGFNVLIKTIYKSKARFDYMLKQRRSFFMIASMYKRLWQILTSRRYKTVIVRRELLLYNDYGNLFMEKLLLRIHPNAILDFDDDIAAAKKQPKKIINWYGRLMREHGDKFNETIKMYNRFIVASNYLKERVTSTNPKVDENHIIVIPTCVDYNKYPSKKYPKNIQKITFGWIGGDHNYPQLRLIIPALNKLYCEHDFKLIVIGGSKFECEARFNLEFIHWSLETEIENLHLIDVGLMPLKESGITKGKGGFKLIQYMGLGIVGLASPITINQDIVEDGVNSFLVKNDDWEQSLKGVLSSVHEFGEIGKRARDTILKKYSFTANLEKYKALIEKPA